MTHLYSLQCSQLVTILSDPRVYNGHPFSCEHVYSDWQEIYPGDNLDHMVSSWETFQRINPKDKYRIVNLETGKVVPVLVPHERKLIGFLAMRVWNAIANDVVSGLGRGATRAEVKEAVCDCDRLTAYARKDEREALATFLAMAPEEQSNTLDHVFTYEEYV